MTSENESMSGLVELHSQEQELDSKKNLSTILNRNGLGVVELQLQMSE